MLAYLRRGCLLLASLLLLAIGLVGEALAQSGTGGLPLPPGEIISGPVFRSDGTFVPEIDTGTNANTYIFSVPPTESFAPSASRPRGAHLSVDAICAGLYRRRHRSRRPVSCRVEYHKGTER